jgi:hypothetical protein
MKDASFKATLKGSLFSIFFTFPVHSDSTTFIKPLKVRMNYIEMSGSYDAVTQNVSVIKISPSMQ